MNKIVIGMIITMLLVACSSSSDKAPSIDTSGIKTISLQSENQLGVSAWDGAIEAVQQATLSAQTNDRVAKVFVDVNDRVAANELLIQLSAVEQQAGVNTAQAQLNAVKAQAVAAQNTYQRYESLAKQQYISKQQLDQALSERNAANAQVAALQAQVIQANQQSAYTQIRAPFDSIVSNRLVEPGESINIGQPLMQVFNPNQLRLEVQVPQSVAELIRKNPKAIIQFEDHSRLQAEQVLVFPSADAGALSVTIRIPLPNTDKALKPGQLAKVLFDVPNALQNISIPRSAIWQRGELSAVYVVTDHAILLRQVRLGEVHGDTVQLISGVRADERIALDPTQASNALVTYKAKVQHD